MALRIPKAVVEEARLQEGDLLSLDVSSNGNIVVRPRRKKYRLQQLVSRITSKNRHGETDWGAPAGRESW